MKKTFKELQEIDIVAGGMYARNPSLKGSKFGYAYHKFTRENYSPLLEEFRNKMEDLNIQFCLEDDKTHAILKNNGEYQFTKDALIELRKKSEELKNYFDKREVEITPFISSYIPEDMTDFEKEMLSGIII